MTDVLTRRERWACQVAPVPIEAQLIATIAGDCLLEELETWPKPGLVSHVDRGSHEDMDADMFRASVNAIEPYFQDLAEAGASGRNMSVLRTIGLDAEAAMLAATSGINTHRGAIFGLGLLCAAAGAKSGDRGDHELSLGTRVVRLWGRGIVEGAIPPNSHGGRVRRRFGAGGARMEAALGFPSIYNCGLPALERARLKAPDEAEAQRVETCFALIATVEDTNLLHRGGYEGLDFARSAALGFLQSGGVGRSDWRQRARSVHNSFVARRLSPGGSADLLAMTLFVAAMERASR
ncbi:MULTISPECIES: triphosphoribosyl-dephospho-CoA synthase MdcB [Mesorhizobium]|uniref:triphosphoribosyl-dephospho-CoA synthase MdcB n=1 Tax=Mesorhizobium TaxID=68287 RepID=UPI0003CE99BA|nr:MULTISPECIES: triphosphoribosyl-dephospho-CoA synthase MdcB [Mesorhizobium]ESY68918.1 triphosphoribosyl-dephospho-CoA synthase [Mesorhizobium sp. LNHC232B00]WJI40618.1 triphosphoribosyl-dephospho-CoA synthase MdcB [Mesorhizobium opportunistum]